MKELNDGGHPIDLFGHDTTRKPRVKKGKRAKRKAPLMSATKATLHPATGGGGHEG